MQFLARKHSGLRVVLDPRFRKKEMGRTTTESLTGATKLGLTIEFVNGVYETKDPEVIELIKAHPSYGMDFFSADLKEVIVPTEEAIQAENEKKEVVEEIASVCTEPGCGKRFRNQTALNGHLRIHSAS